MSEPTTEAGRRRALDRDRLVRAIIEVRLAGRLGPVGPTDWERNPDDRWEWYASPNEMADEIIAAYEKAAPGT